MKAPLAVIAALSAAAASQAEPAVGDCQGWQANASNVDWSQPSPTYAEGAIRLVALDTVEPAAAAFHIMVLMPGDLEFGQLCYLVSAELEGAGFAGVDLSRAVASYNPQTGLSVTMPVTEMLPNGAFATTPLLLVINQTEPSVIAKLLN